MTTLGTFSNLNKGTTSVQRTFNVGSFAGRTVTLRFTGTEDGQPADVLPSSTIWH
jgi:aminopeptidase S